MNVADSYDAIPYESTPFPETHPGHLACLARLYGVDAPPPTRCRVLELGCASGGNLLPMAARLPGSQFTGIELSPEQALEGAARVEELGLSNCKIQQADILELKDDGTRFDYIITHGVYSWSPPNVRSRIMELSSQLLSPQGIAYISYNSLPGWRMRGMLRDMLMHQVRDISSPKARLEAAQSYLAYLEAGLGGLEAAHTGYLQEEIERIRHAHPSYLYHEYLETFNEPMLLHDFVSEASRHGLDYLCDIDQALQFPGYLGEQAEQVLSLIEDPLEKLQQTDFFLNRNFHQSLLCHQGLQASNFPNIECLREFSWVADMQPPKKLDLRRTKPAPFMHQEGEKYEVSHPLTKAAIALLAEQFPTPSSFTDLLERAQKWVRGNGGQPFAEQEEELLSELFALYAMGIIHARPLDMLDTRANLNPMQMESVAQLGILRGDNHIPTYHHASINLDPFAQEVVRRLDGDINKDELLENLLLAFKPGKALEGLVDPAMPADQLTSHVAHHLDQLLNLFRKHGVLG